MNIHRALSDIADIRAQLDRTESYRGFRSAAVGISVFVLFVGAWVERVWVAQPLIEVDRYLTVWFCVAMVSALIAFTEMLVRAKVSDNELVAKIHWSLTWHILPSLVVGFVLTVLIAGHALEQTRGGSALMWALPGIWSMVYGVGLLSCRRHLPVQAVGVGVYFLAAGMVLLVYSWTTRELAGWQMIASFGVGQAFLATVLFWNLERRRG